MRVLKEFKKYLNVWTTNVEYEKIFNCRVINPTYEKDKWLYNNEFFLDKRLWLKEFVSEDYHYTDDVVIYNNKYYLYHNDTEMFVWVKDWNSIKKISWPHLYSPNNPIRFTKWESANWIKKESDLTISSWATYDDNTLIVNEDWVYDDWYIILDVWEWFDIEAWDKVLFKSNVYAWATVEVELYQWWLIYVMWINDRGSLPISGDKIDIYKDSWLVPLIWTSEWVMAIHINWTDECSSTNVLVWNIDDLDEFNWNIFVAKNETMYFSRKTYHDNVQFYRASDRRRIRGLYKFISNGKVMIALWDDNRLISPLVSDVADSQWFTSYPLEYDSKLYSKYSYTFNEWTLYILQADKMLMKIDTVWINGTAFNLSSSSTVESVRWLLSDIDDYDSPNKWELYVNHNKNDTKLHFLYNKKTGGTIEYEYDKVYKHWLLHQYEESIYKISDQFLCNWHVCDIGWYTDLWKEYKQSINYTIKTPSLITKVWLVRMIMWISNDFPLKYNIDIDVESSHSVTRKSYKINHMTFDTMPIDHSLDFFNITNNGKDNKHNGVIASVQINPMMSGRIHRYDINWYDRFIYWYSYTLAVDSNIFVNERNFSR